MKKLIIATAVAMTLSAAAHADSTALLKLKGVLTNDACTPTLSGGGTVDFGTKYTYALSPTATNQLGNKDLTLTIACPSPTKVGWTMTDEKVDSLVTLNIENARFDGAAIRYEPVEFGVGKTAGGIKIGAYSVAIDADNTLADGTKSDVYIADRASGTYEWRTKVTNDQNWSLVYGDSDQTYTVGSDMQPAAFTNAVFPLRVALAVQDTTTLAITDDTPIDGQATVTLYYL